MLLCAQRIRESNLSPKKDYSLDILSSDFIDKVPVLVLGFDSEGKIIYWNKKAEQITGYKKSEVTKRNVSFLSEIFIQNKNIINASANIDPSLLLFKHRDDNMETTIETKNKEKRNLVWNAYSIKSENGKKEVTVVLAMDVTFKKLLQRDIAIKERHIKTTTSRLKKYISIDPQTGLMNYRHFIHQLSSSFYESFEKGQALSLVLLDIDYFCSINNIHGVTQGNQILRKLSLILKSKMPKGSFVGRVGGAEFAIILPKTDIKNAFHFASTLFSHISDYNFGYKSFDSSINLSLHMAIGGYPHCEDICTSDQLFDRVTDKLHEAKKIGNKSIMICSSNEKLHRENGNGQNHDSNDFRYTMEFVNALANTVKTKDYYTQEHSAAMSDYAVDIAKYMGMQEAEITDVKFGSVLHDIGKIGIDKMILLKPASLSKTEFEIIKQHPRIGAEIIRNVHPLKGVVPYVLYHHERYDGTGYLEGLSGEEIPLGARIISISDVFQALTSDRPYRKSLPVKDAFKIIKTYSGKYFDPKVVKAFFEVYSDPQVKK